MMNKTFSLEFVAPADCKAAEDFQILQKAFDYAQRTHEEHMRKSVEPFFARLYEVAENVWAKYRDVELTAAAFLRDTIEDCDAVDNSGDIYQQFGDNIGFIVDGVNNCKFDFYKQDEKFDDKTVRFLWAGQQDVRVLLLKLANQEHSLSAAKSLEKEQQIKISFETQAVYEPLKRILSYDHPVSLQESLKKFTAFIAENKLSDFVALKEHLFNETFERIDNDLYPTIYENTDSVVWKTYGMNMYMFLSNSPIFTNKIDFTLVTASCREDVEAFFKFKTD